MSQASHLEIFGTPFSNFVRGVRMAIAEKGIAYEYHPVRPHSSEALAIHPLGLVPGLQHGAVRIAESLAIIGYLDGLWPNLPMGPSGSVAESAEVLQWISLVSTAVDQILIRRYVIRYAFPTGPGGQPDRDAIDAALPDVANILRVLDGQLSERVYLAANRFTFADALLVATLAPTLRRPEAAELALETPAVRRYFSLHSKRESFAITAPQA